jgi:predicted transglutaminase-like cysteine proteinase
MSRFVYRFVALMVGGLLLVGAGLPATSAEELASLPPADSKPDLPAHVEREIHVDGVGQFHKWTDMVARWDAEIARVNACTANGQSDRCVPVEWARLTARLKGLDQRAMLDDVNHTLNAHPYVASLDNWGTPDHWETPFEFMSRDGQCQDYAIAKFMVLRAMGFTNEQLRVLVVRDVDRQLDHAVLVAYLDNQAWLLDSLNDTVVPLSTASAYRAYYAINESGWWLYLPNPIGITMVPPAQIASR